MLTDITQRKSAEEELRKKVTELNMANEEMSMAFEELRSTEETLVTRNRELEEQRKALADSRDAVTLANRKLNLLSSITRHDVLNQLTVLNGYVELSKLSPGQTSGNLVDKELDVINRIYHQITFTQEYQDIGVQAPCWQDVGKTIGKSAADLDLRGIRMDLRIPGVEIYADPLLPRVFYNLLDNVIRYGEKATRVVISCEPGPGGMVIAVEDDGVGIDPSEKTRIFEKGVGKNTGFGLFLSTGILQITGLSITETGIPGAGARFEILVPEGAYRSCKK
jgi:signal transduction histidine kinase